MIKKYILNIGKIFIKLSGHFDTYLVESFKKNPNKKELNEFINIYNRIKDKTLLDRFRAYMLWQLATYAKNLKGDFAEVGVFKGGSAYLILSLLKGSRMVYLFDTFKGLPAVEEGVDKITPKSFNGITVKDVLNFLSEFKNKRIVQGKFPETGNCIANKKFSYVYLDVDIYPSTIESLSFFGLK